MKVNRALLMTIHNICIHYSRMEVQPVTGYVNGHRNLEEEHILRIKVAQGHQETHSSTAVCQHVQHCSKLCGWWRKYNQITEILWFSITSFLKYDLILPQPNEETCHVKWYQIYPTTSLLSLYNPIRSWERKITCYFSQCMGVYGCV